MRTLSILMVVGILILAAVPAAAENHRQNNDQVVVDHPQARRLGATGHATLKLSPMFLEIHKINETALATEQDLLTRLAACQEEQEVVRLVSSLEQLDTERQLSVLKIRLKYARLGHQYDLVFQLRRDILDLLKRDAAPLM